MPFHSLLEHGRGNQGSSNEAPIEWPDFTNQLTGWKLLLPLMTFLLYLYLPYKRKKKEKGENG